MTSLKKSIETLLDVFVDFSYLDSKVLTRLKIRTVDIPSNTLERAGFAASQGL